MRAPIMDKRTRSRYGCSKCKERRLKCDETRPGCVQCEKRKVPCPGYRQAFRWSDKYEVFRKENEENDAPMSRTTVLSPEERTFSPSNSAGSFAAGQERVDHNNSLPQHPTPHTRPRHEETRNGFPSSSGGLFSLLDLGNQMELGDSHGGSSFDLRVDSVPRRFDGFETDTLSRHHLHDLLQSTRQNIPSHSSVLSNFPAPIGRSSALSPASQRTVTSEAESRSTLFTQACLDQNIFIRYYCDEICPLNSSFDWPDNPFRRVVSRYIDSSPLIRNCIVSMSAVHLLQDNDRMISLSRKYHSAAVELLSTAIFELEGEAGHPGHPRSLTSGIEYSKQLEEVLLASLLLGISAPWFDPSDVGIPHLLSARRLCEKWLCSLTDDPGYDTRHAALDRDKSFIIGAMAYWEACAAFVIDQPLCAIDYLQPFSVNPDSGPAMLNPYTGVSTPLFVCLAGVGIVARQKRVLARLESLGWPRGAYQPMVDELLQAARHLGACTLKYTFPSQASIPGIQDCASSVQELECFSQMYRFAILLELCRNFPGLFVGREDGVSVDANDELTPGSAHSRASADVVPVSGDHKKLVFELATLILGLLEEMPDGHESTVGQTLALIISGSVLHDASKAIDLDKSSTTLRCMFIGELTAITSRLRVISKWRSFVLRRLNENAEYFGFETMFKRAKQLLDKVWSEMDNLCEGISPPHAAQNQGPLSIHWTEVMDNCKLETLFG